MKKKIKKRTLTYFLGLTLLGIFTSTIVGIYFAREATIAKHHESCQNLARETLFNIQTVYDNALKNINVISQNDLIKNNIQDDKTLRKELIKLKSLFSTYDDITLLNKEGGVIVSTDYNYNSGWKYRDFFADTISTKTPQTSNAYFLPDPLRYITSFTASVLDGQGNLIAIVSAQLNMASIQNIVNHVKLNDTGFAYLLNEKELFLAHPDKDKILQKASLEDLKTLKENPLKFTTYLDESEYIGSSHSHMEKTLVVIQKRTEVLKEFNKILYGIIISSSLVAIIVMFFGFRFSNSLTSPIEELNSAMNKFSKGESNIRTQIHRDDEIGELSTSFNAMIDEVMHFRTDLENLVKERTEELEEAKDAAEAANQAKTAFLANMSHEIRTPMNAILGFSQIMQEMETDEEKKQFLSSIMTSGKTLLSIINDILDVSKLESGKFHIVLTKASLNAIFADTCTILKNEANKKKLTLDYTIPEDFPKLIIADENRIRQIMINLVGNAIKFTDKGFVKIVSKWEYGDDLKKYISVSIQVQDSGIGIAADEQEDVFKEFIQSKNQGDKLYQGTGLGLSICKKLVTLMGGTMRVESSLHQGSTFEINFPKMEVSSFDLPFKENTDLSLDFLNFQQNKVLLVDDNESNLIFLEKILKDRNVEVILSKNGEDAIKKLQNIEPKIILMDLQMPKINGFQAAETIKSQTSTKDIPIIAISATLVDENTDSFKNLFEAFIPKPVNITHLYDELTNYLEYSYNKEGFSKKA